MKDIRCFQYSWEKIQQKVTRRTFSTIEIDYSNLDNEFKLIKENVFYKCFIEPIIRVQNEQLAEKIQSARYEKKQVKKGEIISREFQQFFHECASHYTFASELYEEMKSKVVQ